jgi:hypothetical protein
LSTINLGEIIYATKRTFGGQKKIEVLAHVERLGIRILPVPNDLVFRAAELQGLFQHVVRGLFRPGIRRGTRS